MQAALTFYSCQYLVCPVRKFQWEMLEGCNRISEPWGQQTASGDDTVNLGENGYFNDIVFSSSGVKKPKPPGAGIRCAMC
jgi:hypothetical protein